MYITFHFFIFFISYSSFRDLIKIHMILFVFCASYVRFPHFYGVSLPLPIIPTGEGGLTPQRLESRGNQPPQKRPPGATAQRRPPRRSRAASFVGLQMPRKNLEQFEKLRKSEFSIFQKLFFIFQCLIQFVVSFPDVFVFCTL